MKDWTDIVTTIFAAVILGFILFLVVGLIFQWLWNSSIAEIFSLKEITYNQALALFALISICIGVCRK